MNEDLKEKLQCDEARQQQKPWSWKPPDLWVGGLWYHRIVRELRIASDTMEDSEVVFQEGLIILDWYWDNYMATHPEPKQLQILWWMFPTKHWEGLREGTSMNFLST